jgi:hypothetical protein
MSSGLVPLLRCPSCGIPKQVSLKYRTAVGLSAFETALPGGLQTPNGCPPKKNFLEEAESHNETMRLAWPRSCPGIGEAPTISMESRSRELARPGAVGESSTVLWC